MLRAQGIGEGHVVVPLPEPVVSLAALRSTLILGSRESLRVAGFFPEYERHLDAAHARALDHLVPAAWVPVPLVLAHYFACDRLGLTPKQIENIGASTFERVKGTIVGTALRLAASPEGLLEALGRFWARGHDGSAIGVVLAGPKEARLRLVGSPLARSPYYRSAARGMVRGVLGAVARACYVHEVPGETTSSAMTLRAQWV